MEMNRKTYWRRWILAMSAAAALAGGAAYAMQKECWNCAPCGCGPDGGYIMCCEVSTC